MSEPPRAVRCSHAVAMNVAHYEMKYGELPPQNRMTVAYVDELSNQQDTMVTNGMEKPWPGC